jgi:uncharacterized membrane protein
MDLARCFRHLNTTRWSLRRRFPEATLDSIEQTIRESESRHRGEIRFAIEGSLDAWSALRGVESRQRAVEVFADLGVWDTEEDNGVLIYVLLADRRVEILADRGFGTRVDATEWSEVCRQMEREFAESRFDTGSRQGVRAVGALLERSFPSAGGDSNELPDSPVVL